jgi:translation initiation factor 1
MDRMGKKRSSDEAPAAATKPFHDAFARLRERLPEGYVPPPAPPAAPASAPAARPGDAAAPGPARAVVRLERKGRGGKEATVVEKLALPASALATWLDEAKRALGCGGAVEDGALVLQGDQRERVARWLERRGVRKVTVGT